MTEREIQWMGFKIIEGTGEILQLEGRAIKITQSEQQRENTLKKMRGSGTYGSITKDLTFMSLESMSWKERRIQMRLKIYLKE